MIMIIIIIIIIIRLYYYWPRMTGEAAEREKGR